MKRLLPAALLKTPQIYGPGSTVATFEKSYISTGDYFHPNLTEVVSADQQIPGNYFTQYKYFKIISVVVSTLPSSTADMMTVNMLWSGVDYPDLAHDDTCKRVPITTTGMNFAIFKPPKVISTYSGLAHNFVVDVGKYTPTQNVLVNGTPVLPGTLSVALPSNARIIVYVKIEFRGQTTGYYDKP